MFLNAHRDIRVLIRRLIREINYPIGKLYITTGNEDPNDTIGGTWVKIAGGYLYGCNNSLINTDYTGSGTQPHSLTSDELPQHKHTLTSYYDDANYNHGTIPSDYGAYSLPYDAGTIIRHQYTDESGGGNQGHSHNVATIGAYIWKRTK